MGNVATLVLTDAALKEAQQFLYLTKNTTDLHPEFNPIHRLALGAVLSMEFILALLEKEKRHAISLEFNSHKNPCSCGVHE